jgi:16S rRNA (cytidine1402-2'-O)-methyltransferase
MFQARSESPLNYGTLTVAAVSAGPAADVAARLKTTLAEAGLIAAPDASSLRSLAAALGVALAGRVVSLAAAPGWAPELLAELVAGQDVLLVTDAGPAGTDQAAGPAGPSGAAGAAGAVRGFITAAAAAGIRVIALPGPSPIVAALAVAGLPADRFTFEGGPPRMAETRNRRFAELAAERRTLIFRETPGRLAQTLAELAAAFGASRAAVVCRALATADQDVQRGTLGALAGRTDGAPLPGRADSAAPTRRASGAAQDPVESDVTIVVAGAPIPDAAESPTEPEALGDALALVRALVRGGATTRDAVAAVAAQSGLRRRDLYNAAAGEVANAASNPKEGKRR